MNKYGITIFLLGVIISNLMDYKYFYYIQYNIYIMYALVHVYANYSCILVTLFYDSNPKDNEIKVV